MLIDGTVLSYADSYRIVYPSFPLSFIVTEALLVTVRLVSLTKQPRMTGRSN